jgi:hypothetical protein
MDTHESNIKVKVHERTKRRAEHALGLSPTLHTCDA